MNSLNGGYAMIKYNSTQEELQIAYRSKKPVLCYDENRRAHWAVIEETATESVDEETQEPITIYEYSFRLIDEASGSEVHLYRHEIEISKPFGEGKGLNLLLQIHTTSNNAINSMSLLQQNITNTRKIQCSGWIMNPNTTTMAVIVGFNVSTTTVFYAKNQNYPAEYMIENLGTLIYYDTITQIF